MLTLEQTLAKNVPKLEGLNPIVKEAARQLVINSYNRGVPILITEGYRSPQKQAEYYKIGRRGIKGERPITWAKPGTSYHQHRLAIDFALLVGEKQVVWDTRADFDKDKVSDWMEVITEAKKLGFKAGIDWIGSKNDPPHLEMTFGLRIKDLLAGKKPPTQLAVVKPTVKVASVVSKPDPNKCLIEVNNRLLSATGIIRDGRSYLPVRALGNSAGVSIGFVGGKATLGKGALETTIVIDGTGYAWTREIADVLGYTIVWDAVQRKVEMTKGAR